MTGAEDETFKAPEFFAPAGTLEKMRAAYDFGADAVYAGQPRYSLRARNNEFKLEQFATGIAEAHRRGKPFDCTLLAELEGLANRGYTDGFYERHHTAEHQNYLKGYSESGRSQYVGDVVSFDAASGMAEIVVKNRFTVGDRLEIIHPAGNREVMVETLFNGGWGAGRTGSGQRSYGQDAAGNAEKALLARFL